MSETGWAWLFITVIGFLIFWAISNNERKKRESEAERVQIAAEIARKQAVEDERAINSILLTTRADYSRDYRIISEKAWIKSTSESQEAAERDLKLKAARIGVNGIVKLRSSRRAQEYQAGVGPKGNPYFRTAQVTDWEAQAVVLKSKSIEDRSFVKDTSAAPTVPVEVVIVAAMSEPTLSGWVAIDGNNCRPDGEPLPSLPSVRRVVEEVRRRGLIPTAFDGDSGLLGRWLW